MHDGSADSQNAARLQAVGALRGAAGSPGAGQPTVCGSALQGRGRCISGRLDVLAAIASLCGVDDVWELSRGGGYLSKGMERRERKLDEHLRSFEIQTQHSYLQSVMIIDYFLYPEIHLLKLLILSLADPFVFSFISEHKNKLRSFS